MVKTGRWRIKEIWPGGKPAKCVNCGEKGTFQVTFEDSWGKLIVTLCEECAGKEYKELKLQSTLNFPAIA